MSIISETIMLRAGDGARSEMILVHDDSESFDAPGPVLIAMPALGVAARYYLPLAETLAAAKIPTILCDMRGNGSSSERQTDSDFGYSEILQHDLPAAIDSVALQFPKKRMFALGHSLGGHLLLLHAARCADHLHGIILVASGSAYYRAFAFPSNWLTLIATQSARLVTTALGNLPGRCVGFTGRQPRRLISDWAHHAWTGRFAPQGCSGDLEQRLGGLDLPVCAISIAGDSYAPPGAITHLLGKLVAAPVERIDLEDTASTRATSSKSAHFRWVRDSHRLVELIDAWMLARAEVAEPSES